MICIIAGVERSDQNACMKLICSILVAWFVVARSVFADDGLLSLEKDIPFGDLPRQTLDVYAPEKVSAESNVLVFFFGGGFSRGRKENIRRLALSLSRAGTIVVAPNYRLYPEATFPEFVQDAAMAVSYVWQNIRDDEGLPRSIIIGGWSAGAYISALVAYDNRYLEAAGMPPGSIKGFIGLAGPYQGGLCAGHSCPDIFPAGTKADWPVKDFVDVADPPMLLVRGTRDLFVDKSNLVELAAAGRAAGVGVSTLVVEDAFHEDLLSAMEQPGSSVREAVDTFLSTISVE